MRKHYSIAEAIKILDIGRDQLFYWMKTKRLIKMKYEGEGRGARSRVSRKNIFELAVIKELLNNGFDLNLIRKIKSWLDRQKVDKKNIFDSILEDKYRENRKMTYYKRENQFILHLNLPTKIERFVAVDDEGMPGSSWEEAVPDPAHWYKEKYGEKPPSYFFGVLLIGLLAEDLIHRFENMA